MRTVLDSFQEERVDAIRFDRVARIVGEQTNRRNMMKAAAGSALAALGMSAVGRVALGQDVSAEAGFKGQACVDSGDCRRGLVCDTTLTNPRCKYKRNCGGKKSDACQGNSDCCKGRNLTCQNRKCKRNKGN